MRQRNEMFELLQLEQNLGEMIGDRTRRLEITKEPLLQK